MGVKNVLKNTFHFLLPLTSNISASRQNFKNLVDNLLKKGSSYLHAKYLLSSFKTEGALKVADGRTAGHQKIIQLWSYVFNSSNNLKVRKKM